MESLKICGGNIEVPGREACFLRYKAGKYSFELSAPGFELNGKTLTAGLKSVKAVSSRLLKNGVTESVYRGVFAKAPHLSLELAVRHTGLSPVIRFKYTLKSAKPVRMTKSKGSDAVSYFRCSMNKFLSVKAVRLSEFFELPHCYKLTEKTMEDKDFNGLPEQGPILCGVSEKFSVLLAYEHASQHPNTFVTFGLSKGKKVELRAVKGNYLKGTELGCSEVYETIWFELGGVNGGEDALAKEYRTFILKYMAEDNGSRAPNIYYNTWAAQERDEWWHGKDYFNSIKLKNVLKQIDVAAKLGIEVFVIDGGWYDRAGDWGVNLKLFPDAMKKVKARLDSYGMRLGLWFSPVMASNKSELIKRIPECIKGANGKKDEGFELWDKDPTRWMCFVSEHRDEFVKRLKELVDETGVSYFKIDFYDQVPCGEPDHYHGGSDVSEQERLDYWSFKAPLVLVQTAEELARKCPGAVIDYDVTEARRAVGLAQLQAGKYFLLNNGPYYKNFNVPVPKDTDSNVFVYPGPARPRILRQGLSFDKWIPSVLFLTGYLTDKPENSQIINLASLILGQNGIWGDLLLLDKKDTVSIRKWLDIYKQVRNDITEASPVRTGETGGCPEVHEKLSANGRGVVVIFSEAKGIHEYITSAKPASGVKHNDGVKLLRLKDGRIKITAKFLEASAKMIFFGVN